MSNNEIGKKRARYAPNSGKLILLAINLKSMEIDNVPAYVDLEDEVRIGNHDVFANQ